MSTRASQVVIIVDPTIGENMKELAVTRPIWVCDSAVNRRAADRLRAGIDKADWITTFDFDDAASGEATLLSVLDTVDMHHPGWTSLHVVGAEPDWSVQEALAAYGEGSFECGAVGFVFHRETPRSS